MIHKQKDTYEISRTKNQQPLNLRENLPKNVLKDHKNNHLASCNSDHGGRLLYRLAVLIILDGTMIVGVFTLN